MNREKFPEKVLTIQCFPRILVNCGYKKTDMRRELLMVK